MFVISEFDLTLSVFNQLGINLTNLTVPGYESPGEIFLTGLTVVYWLLLLRQQ